MNENLKNSNQLDLIVVLGMHRSGTSAITKALEALGVELGDNLMPAQSDNIKGFFEDLDIVNFNDELLSHLRLKWDSITFINDCHVNQLQSSGYVLKAANLIREKTQKYPLFGLKDPRIAKLIKFWHIVFEHCKLNAGYIIVNRNPISVARSLKQRNGFDSEKSYYMWLDHVIPSILTVHDSNHIFIDFDVFISNPEKNIKRIANKFNLSINPITLSEYIQNFLDFKLRHSVDLIQDLAIDPKMPLLLKDLYTSLYNISCSYDILTLTDKEINSYNVVKTILEDFFIYGNLIFNQLENSTFSIAEKSNQIANLNDSLESKSNQIANLNDSLESKSNQIANLNDSLESKSNQIATLNDSLESKSNQIANLNDSLESKSNQIANLNDSLESKSNQIANLNDSLESKSNQIANLNDSLESKSNQIANLNDSLESIANQIANLNDSLECKSVEIAYLGSAVDSAIAWQKRSLFRRIFHKWRPPFSHYEKINFVKKLERSIRKRRNKFIRKYITKKQNTKLTLLDSTPTTEEIHFRTSDNPIVSVIIPVYGQIEYTLKCLKSISILPPTFNIEIIVINDCSLDNSFASLNKVKGIKLINNKNNLGFIKSCNAGASEAKGEYLHFLNNDTQVTAGWLDELILTFERFPGAGLVGSKLVYPDGSLQEAGGIIWQDGSAWNFGRNQDASAPIYNYAREVDYCSGASILVPKHLFEELGGFDEHYLPAYCEDSDLALKIRDKGYRVLYQPLSVIVHFEGVSSGTDTSTGVKAYQVENMKKVYERWKHRLIHHQPNAVDVDAAKDRIASHRVLFLDQCTPTPDNDSGSIDALNTMIMLRDMGFQVTFIPVSNLSYDPKYTALIQSYGIEAVYYPYTASVEEHLKEYGQRYNLIFACRHNTLDPYYEILRTLAPAAKILFHTVDLHFLREEREAKIKDNNQLLMNAQHTKEIELRLMRNCELTTVISHTEKNVLESHCSKRAVKVMPYSRHIRGTSVSFQKRSGIVFVGGFQHSPNTDAVEFFVSDIMPHLRQLVPNIIFHIVGSKVPHEVRKLETSDIVIHGYVQDLEPLLDQMRIAVAPLRYGAGIKGKIGSAMCVGLPVVATSLATEGMQLSDNKTVMVADHPADFASKIALLYSNEDMWNQMSRDGLDFAKNKWGSCEAESILRNILLEAGIEAPISKHPIRLWS